MYINITKKHLMTFSIIVGIIITFILSGKEQNPADELQSSIAEKVIRFHVLANSDSEEDQALKLKVKEAVVTYLNPSFVIALYTIMLVNINVIITVIKINIRDL